MVITLQKATKKHKLPSYKQILYKLGGYYLVPHELLHVLAYRLINKPCQYKWGDYEVKSLAPKNKREKLFVLLFPFVTCWILGGIFIGLWLLSAFFITIPPKRYFIDGPTWHFGFMIMAMVCIIYSGTAHQDLIDAYGWLFKYKASYDSPKPHCQVENNQNQHQYSILKSKIH